MGILPAYIAKDGCDIVKFNEYVQEQCNSLLQSGEKSQVILNNLFKAYLTVSEPNFNECTRMQNINYIQCKNFGIDQLMDVAQHCYKLLVRDNNWKPSKDANNHIVALIAEIASIGKGNKSERDKSDKKRTSEKPNKGTRSPQLLLPPNLQLRK